MKTSLFIFVAALAVPLQAETLSGRVVGIADGDTLTLIDSSDQHHRIRLSGIDAPEQAQPFGERSKASLSILAYDQQASADCPKRDHYGRAVCTVIVNGKDVGLEQVASGMAWWYRRYASEQSLQARSDYEAAELLAKARPLGLWSDQNPTPPWDWRRTRRQK